MVEPGGVVDAHLHLWDPARLSMGWLSAVPGLDRPVSESDYAPTARPLGIDAAVLVEAAVDDVSLEDELVWMREHLAARGIVAAAVLGWRPEADAASVAAWLDRLDAEPGVVGVREVVHPAEIDADAPASAGRIASAIEAGRRGLVVDVCARPDQLAAVRRLVEAAPDTRFVLDHLGRPRTSEPLDPAWRASLAAIAGKPNVAVKISALIECAEGAAWDVATFRPFIETGLELFGPDRCLWGSNWPVCTATADGLHRWFEAIAETIGDLAAGERVAVMGGTARRVYGLGED